MGEDSGYRFNGGIMQLFIPPLSHLFFYWVSNRLHIYAFTIPDKATHQQVTANISFIHLPCIQINSKKHTVMAGSTVEIFHIKTHA
jgi:hypothetical protein